MTAPEGFFYAAQDADSFVSPTEIEPEEGAFYVWNYAELQELLSAAELTALTEQFTVTEKGNFEGQNVLQRYSPGVLSQEIESAFRKLFTVRYGASPEETSTFPPAHNNHEAKALPWAGRIPSVTDTKMIVAWNSLMISGLARSAMVLQNVEYLQIAANAAAFIVQHQQQGGRFHRLNYEGQASVQAQSEDYALFIKALLDLDQATIALRPAHPSNGLDQAVQLQAEFDEYLWSVELGGYFNTDNRTDLVVRERSFEDNAIPAANGIAIANLVRLALVTEDLDYLDRAEQALQAFSQVMSQSPQACPSLFAALDWFRNHTLIRSTLTQVTELARQYLPTVMLKVEELPAGAIALVCQGLSCNEPACTIEQLQAQVQQSLVRSL